MTGTALTPRQALKSELARFEPSLQSLLPKGYEASRLITGALVATTNNPDLLKCAPVTIAAALARVAQWGLDVGTTAHLVPYGSKCTPVADYKGLVQLMCRAGARKVEAHVVREGDEYEEQRGTDPFLRHTPKSNDTPIIRAYCIVWLRGGVTQFESMAVEDIEAIRKKHSHSWKSGPLPVWYARKTVIRQASRYVPMTAELSRVLAEDDTEIQVDADGVVLTAEELDTKYERVRVPGMPSVMDAVDSYAPGDGEEG